MFLRYVPCCPLQMGCKRLCMWLRPWCWHCQLSCLRCYCGMYNSCITTLENSTTTVVFIELYFVRFACLGIGHLPCSQPHRPISGVLHVSLSRLARYAFVTSLFMCAWVCKCKDLILICIKQFSLMLLQFCVSGGDDFADGWTSVIDAVFSGGVARQSHLHNSVWIHVCQNIPVRIWWCYDVAYPSSHTKYSLIID